MTSSDDTDPPTRVVPTLLALLAFAPLLALLWWSVAGPRLDTAAIDWSELGFDVREGDAPLELPEVHDVEWVRRRMSGWQGELGGRLDSPVPVGHERYAAVVRTGERSGVAPLQALAGVVEWGADQDEGTRCTFSEPVALDSIRESLELSDDETELGLNNLVGRCADDGPLVAVPVLRRHVMPLSAWERLAGKTAESVKLPHGVVVVGEDGSLDYQPSLSPDLGLPAYPWEVARQALLQAEPDNPAADVGSWADPLYPQVVAIDDRLWWVLPVAPLDGATSTSGYAATPADELSAGELNPVHLHWLDEPHVGPETILAWTEQLLDPLADEDPVVRPTLPSHEGVWHGRVSTAAQSLRYGIDASADGEVCLVDPGDGSAVSCRHNDAVSRR